MTRLTRKEAIEFLDIPEKMFDNFFRNANEFNHLPREGIQGRFYFDSDHLQRWNDSYTWRTIMLTRDDYRTCLDFALAQHFRGYVLSDWSSGRTREFGQKITNWVKGQLAEIAVQKFFENEFGCVVKLDFDIHSSIVSQDIISVEENGNHRVPNLDVGIKSSKPKSSYLVLSPAEVENEDRQSDVYIFCRPDIPDDHLLRITREQIIREVQGQQHYQRYSAHIPDFEPIPCEIAGFCWRRDLDVVTEIPGQDFGSERYVKRTGDLRRENQEWADLISRL